MIEVTIGPGTLTAPGVCFICEGSPRDGESWIYTEREFDPGGFTRLNGKKYICPYCVDSIGKTVGLVRRSGQITSTNKLRSMRVALRDSRDMAVEFAKKIDDKLKETEQLEREAS